MGDFILYHEKWENGNWTLTTSGRHLSAPPRYNARHDYQCSATAIRMP